MSSQAQSIAVAALWMVHPVVHEIEQLGDRIVIESDWLGGVERTIYLDGLEHPPNAERFQQGHSFSRWEGDVLVVDTTNFTDRIYAGLASIGRKHLVEQFALSGAEQAAGVMVAQNDEQFRLVVRQVEETPKIFGWISGDEQAVLKEHGIGGRDSPTRCISAVAMSGLKKSGRSFRFALTSEFDQSRRLKGEYRHEFSSPSRFHCHDRIHPFFQCHCRRSFATFWRISGFVRNMAGGIKHDRRKPSAVCRRVEPGNRAERITALNSTNFACN
jgi:hypothetical protein